MDVWCVRLSSDAPALERAHALLAADERERARRFTDAAARRRFVLARAALRTLLASAVTARPEEIVFTYGAHGKPALTGAAATIGFNVAHAQDLAAFVVARGYAPGIDIESYRDRPDLEQIAERFFCAAERADLASVPAGRRSAAFYDLWVRKEAYLKALGSGLATPLDGFHVTRATEGSSLAAVFAQPGEAAAWSVRPFTPAPGFAGAVAVRAPDVTLHVHGVESIDMLL